MKGIAARGRSGIVLLVSVMMCCTQGWAQADCDSTCTLTDITITDSTLVAPSMTGQADIRTDKQPDEPKIRIKPQEVIVPVAMLTVGAVAISNPKLCDIKQDVRSGFRRWRGDHNKVNIESWMPLSIPIICLAFDHKKTRHSFAERMTVKATSYAMLYTVMPITRRCVREKRPDGHSNHAFVSAKSANTFMLAEQIRIERGWGWGMMAYGIATGVGVMQMYNDRAYINDVVAGAGMGILCTHVAYWLLPLERRMWNRHKEHLRKKKAAMMLVPTYEPTAQTIGVAFSAHL